MFDIAATRRGPHWQLAPVERAQLGDALANVIRHVPLPERELGIAADIAALGFVMYAIATPRIRHDQALLAGVQQAATIATPAAPSASSSSLEDVAQVRLQAALRERIGDVPLNLGDPTHVAALNELASAGIGVSGDAVGTHDAPAYPAFDPATNGAQVNDPSVIEGQ